MRFGCRKQRLFSLKRGLRHFVLDDVPSAKRSLQERLVEACVWPGVAVSRKQLRAGVRGPRCMGNMGRLERRSMAYWGATWWRKVCAGSRAPHPASSGCPWRCPSACGLRCAFGGRLVGPAHCVHATLCCGPGECLNAPGRPASRRWRRRCHRRAVRQVPPDGARHWRAVAYSPFAGWPASAVAGLCPITGV